MNNQAIMSGGMLRRRMILVLACLILVLSACNLMQASAPFVLVVTATTSATVPATQTPEPTATQPAPPETGTAAESARSGTVDTSQFVLPDCSVQHPEWPIYIVKAGDTLAKIAAKVNSTTSLLAQVNCLANINLIYVGQQLHVPLTFVPEDPVEPVPNIPLVDIGIQPAHVCVVKPTSTQASIWGAGVSGGPAALLVGRVLFVRHADNAYIVELPSGGVQGWVSATEAQLEGTGCPPAGDTNPNFPPNLPVITIGDAPPANLCAVVKDPSPGTRYVYGGASSAHAPIAIMGDYLPFVAVAMNGYEVGLPGWDMNGWVPADGVHLSGSTCP